MDNFDIVEDWFNELEESRRIEIQHRYFEHNKYFEELGNSFYDMDYNYNTVNFIIDYRFNNNLLTEEENNQLTYLLNELY